MITLSNKAIEQLKKIAADEEVPLLIRIRILGGGCAGFQYDMYFDDADPGPMDDIIQQDDIKLVVDQLSLQYLDGTEIDYLDGLMSSGFKFNNPKVSSSCGCGSSVSF